MSSLSTHLSKLYPLELFAYNEAARKVGLLDHTIEAIQGRRLQIEGEEWLDFLASNYLSFYSHPVFQEEWKAASERWGWSWNVPAVYARSGLSEEVQRLFAGLVGAEASLVFPTTLHAANGILPLLAEGGTLLADQRSHPITMEACTIAQARGVSLQTFAHLDPDSLRTRLQTLDPSRPRIVVCDGVSLVGEASPFPAYLGLLDEYDAYLYTDDAYGFGLYGQGPTEAMPLGFGGGGILAHQGIKSERILYAASLSKPFGLPLTFVAGPAKALRRLLLCSEHQVFSSPPSALHLWTAKALFSAHAAAGDQERSQLLQHLTAFRTTIDGLGVPAIAPPFFPIQTFYLQGEACDALAKDLAAARIFCAYQTAPPRFPQGYALRFVFSSEHTAPQIQTLTAILSDLISRPSYRPLFAGGPSGFPTGQGRS